MTVVAAEMPKVQAEYSQLSPDIHSALERITSIRGYGNFRVDQIGEDDLPTVRAVLEGMVGNSLPTHYYDEDANYVSRGRTPVVEARHASFVFGHETNTEGIGKGVWLRIPAPAAHDYLETAPDAERRIRSLSNGRFIAAIGASATIENVLIFEGLAANDSKSFWAGMVLMAANALAITKRVSKGFI